MIKIKFYRIKLYLQKMNNKINFKQKKTKKLRFSNKENIKEKSIIWDKDMGQENIPGKMNLIMLANRLMIRGKAMANSS